MLTIPNKCANITKLSREGQGGTRESEGGKKNQKKCLTNGAWLDIMNKLPREREAQDLEN